MNFTINSITVELVNGTVETIKVYGNFGLSQTKEIYQFFKDTVKAYNSNQFETLEQVKRVVSFTSNQVSLNPECFW